MEKCRRAGNIICGKRQRRWIDSFFGGRGEEVSFLRWAADAATAAAVLPERLWDSPKV